MKEYEYFSNKISLSNIFSHLKRTLQPVNPDVFRPSGLVCFCGVQGSGKTLSAVKYAHNLMVAYPRSMIVTNVSLNPVYFPPDRVMCYNGLKQIVTLQRGEDGLIFLIDEIHLEYNSLESKNMDASIFQLVSQQRKQRKHIIGTTQVFGRMAKPFREQFKYAVLCKNYHGILFRQDVYTADNFASEEDINVALKPVATKWYVPSLDDFDMYDTYQVIRRVGGGFR